VAAINFPTSHFPGQRASEGAGRLYGCYAEPMGDGGRAVAVRHRCAGLVNFGTTDRTTFRGMMTSNGNLYAAYDSRLVRFSSAGGSATDIGVLNGTKKGFFAQNNATTPDKVFVDPDGNIATFTSSAVTNSFDADLPSVNSVDQLDGYFLFTTGLGQIWASDLNAVTINALSFTTDQTSGGLVRGVTWSGRYYAFGNKATGIYSDQGLAPFPLSKTDTIPRGIAGPYCVTGHEPNFSKGLYITGDDNSVYSITGASLSKISPPDLDGLIEAVTDKTTLEMCSYISRGHSFIQISCPAWTWVFNINNSKWHERPSYLQTRSRITQSYYSFGKWLCGDTLTGNVQQITNLAQMEIGNPLVCEVWSAPVQDFPQRSRGMTAYFDFAVGDGDATGVDPIATDPGVEISYSIDGGQTFSIPRIRKLGTQSNGRYRVRINQMKAAGPQGYIWKVRMSDPAHFGLMSGSMTGEPRAA
jgi:hypothetical protein